MSDTKIVPKDAGPDLAAYTIVPIPTGIRIAKASLPLVVIMPLVAFGITNHYKNGTLSDNLPILLAFFIGGIWWAYKLFAKAEKIVFTSAITPIPLNERLRKAELAIGGTIGVCCVVWVLQYANGLLENYWTMVWPLALGGTVFATIFVFDSKFVTLTPEAQQAQQRMVEAKTLQTAVSNERFERFFRKWWVRYPLAALIVWGAMWVASKPNEKAGDWLIIGMALLWAAWLAREIAYVLLGVGAIWLLFKGVAALPVSVAVIIGAIIIAGAMKR